MKIVGWIIKCLAILWASPWSTFGLLIGTAGLATGGRAQRRCGIVEFYGGSVESCFQRIPFMRHAIAITLGHVVLGRSASALDLVRDHELVHVRQYERWGPLFIPAYLLCSAWLWLRGGDPYRDNPFEREAFGDDRPRANRST